MVQCRARRAVPYRNDKRYLRFPLFFIRPSTQVSRSRIYLLKGAIGVTQKPSRSSNATAKITQIADNGNSGAV